jgi:predicted AlkP superfamily phosphohydrolase/phosphomutase
MPSPALAYVGPGAGFAFVTSFFILLISFFLALVTLFTWPFRWVLGTLRGRRALVRSRFRKVVIVGLDGQEPTLTEKYMNEGKLPNFSELVRRGSYHRLQTTLPAESPVAWSSFQTGANPGRHRMFDFFVPDRKSYLPVLASAEISPPPRSISLGKYTIPLGKPRISFNRKGQSFWKILGEHGVFSTVLRVPITFPPEKFKGLLLSAMSVPDLNGTQGTFSYYTSDKEELEKFQGGVQVPVSIEQGRVESYIAGPPSPFRKNGGELKIPFVVQLNGDGKSATLIVDRKKYSLQLGEYTPWIQLRFRAGFGFGVRGICRFYLKESSPEFKLYMSPINIDPRKPALPISHPFTYGIYLAKTLGDYSTLGLAEDTWALNERVLDEEAFLKQAYSIHCEREKMLFDALDKTDRGAVICVFDITDRVQHMFWRFLRDGHPEDGDDPGRPYRDVIPQLYQNMDQLVGRVLERIDEDTLLIVMSDHGFKTFHCGVNLNSWLFKNGHLTLKTGKPTGSEWFQDVDWEKTKAYAMGLGGIYLNLSGREAKGIVQPGEDEKALKRELIEGLEALVDPDQDVKPVAKVYETREHYSGPYVGEAPDLIVGFRPGHRVSWASAVGTTTEAVFEENEKSWSGDHCVNPPDVPGIFFCNQKIEMENPSIMDIGPTVLDVFGVSVPPYFDGRSLLPLHDPEEL